MEHKLKRRAIRRLKIIAGQIRGLERMIAAEKYCVDIIHQSLAVKEALSSLEDLVLQNHLATHVAHQMRSGQTAKAMREIGEIFKLSKRK